jgi:hypothetical protein
MATQPIQTSFAGGEVTPKILGRVDLDLYRRAVKVDEEFIPFPLGSALMRAGSAYRASLAGVVRSIPFNVSGGDPYVVALLDQELRIFAQDGTPQTFLTNLLVNGRFDGGLSPWVGAADWYAGGFVRCVGNDDFRQTDVAVPDDTVLTLRFRARGVAVQVVVEAGAGVFLNETVPLISAWELHSRTLNVPVGTATVLVRFAGAGGVPGVFSCDVDDVFLSDDAAVAADHFETPWTAGQVTAVQFDQDLTKNRAMLVHGNVAPQLLTVNAHGLFEFGAAALVSPPSGWGGTNYPAVIDWGFQGRLWLGAPPDEANTVAASKSGNAFDFTTGADPDDSFSVTASVRGAIRWLQGQRTLLAGAERVEQSIHGAGAVVTSSNIQVEEESAFGSAAHQAVHLGDEVLFLERSGRQIRALSFDAQVKDGWVAPPISLSFEHLIHDIKELHFARKPVPTIIGIRTDGTVFAVTYDRGQQVAAAWRLPAFTSVVTGCVVDSDDGDELVLWVTRGGTTVMEILPLHEVGVNYLDSHVATTLPADGVVDGLDHLEGETVRVVVDGQVEGDQVVTGGEVQAVLAQRIADDPALVGKAVAVGLPYRAKLVTLRPEVAGPRGSSMGAKQRWAQIGLRLNDSALPLVNGQRAADRTPGTDMDEAEPLVTGDVVARNLGWSENGEITIEQDLPLRTEILAIFGTLQANKT